MEETNEPSSIVNPPTPRSRRVVKTSQTHVEHSKKNRNAHLEHFRIVLVRIANQRESEGKCMLQHISEKTTTHEKNE